VSAVGAVVVFPGLGAKGRKIWLTEDSGECGEWGEGKQGTRWEVVRLLGFGAGSGQIHCPLK